MFRLPALNSLILRFAVVSLVLLLIVIPIPQNLTLQGVILPAEQFQLVAGVDGVRTQHLNHQSGRVTSTSWLATTRDGVLDLYVGSASECASGDTLAFVKDWSLEQDLVELESQLFILSKELEVHESGSKATEIHAAEQRLVYARERARERQRILQRSQDLLEKQIISQQEYDQDLTRSRLDDIRVSIAEADLAAAMSGAQTTVLDLAEARITKARKQFNLMEERADRQYVTAPFDGFIYTSEFSDTLLTLVSDGPWVVYIQTPAEVVLAQAISVSGVQILMPDPQMLNPGIPLRISIQNDSTQSLGGTIPIQVKRPSESILKRFIQSWRLS